VAAALREAGLHAVATARIDRLTGGDLEALAAAGLPVQTVTLGTPLDDDACVDALERLRAWQGATGMVRACAPLPIDTSAEQPTTGYDDMRHVALARLVLDNVAHIQAHWGRMGAKLSQACLLFGANDVDAVPARDDMPHGPRRAILEEVRRNLAAASLDAVERDGAFRARGDS
jgi:aminodeoxyfutalosine synthase